MESFVIELFLRGIVLCVLTVMALILFRRTAAAYRHLVCGPALFVLPMLPLAQRLMPTLRILPPQSAATSERATVPPQESGRLSALNPKSEVDVPQAPILGTKPTLFPAGSAAAARSLQTLSPTHHREHAGKSTPVLYAIWGLGAATLLMRLIIALFRLRRLKAESRKASLGGVAVLISEQVKTPLTWGMGVRGSVILLPAALLSGDQAVCDSALRHEQAHIARWDWMWNLLAELVCALCWFQPGAWWLRWRMRLESERACDDRVLLSGIAGPDYAAHILEILRSACTGEIAPAMAQSGGMEERMRHILDAAKPRRAQTKWLAVSAPLALALFLLAALRVSARPAEPLQTNNGTTTVNLRLPSSKQSNSPDQTDKPGTTDRADAPDKPATTARADAADKSGTPARADAPQADANPALMLENVIWGKTVDGLQPGFLLTTPGISSNRRVPLNSHVGYKVLVRNTTGRERVFELRCVNSNELDIPYLIPGDGIADALSRREIPIKYRAANVTELFVFPPAYDIQLAPGESIVVPPDLRLYIGDADKQSYPRIESIKAGMNWIVQPITIYRLTAAEIVEAESFIKSPNSGKAVVMTVDHDGKIGQKSFPVRGAGSGGKQLFARIQVDLIPDRTTSQTAPAENDAIAWGKEWNGIELGMRFPKGVTTFPALSQARFEVVLRSRSDKPTQFYWMGYPTITQFSPELFTPTGKRIDFVQTIAGPYMNHETNLAAGETVVLGTISLPEEERNTLDSLPAGPYLASGSPPINNYQAAFSLDVTLPHGKADVIRTSHIKFTVTRSNAAVRESARQADKPGSLLSADAPQVNVGPAIDLKSVVWGKAEDGLEPGFLLTAPGLPNERRFNSHVAYKVLVRNTTGRERVIELRCLESDPWITAPYLIPNDDLRNALNSRMFSERFRAMGVTDLATWSAAYDVKLAPGEAVVVPGELGLYIGDADKQSFPRMESIKRGMNWIVQPITIRRLTAAEVAEAESILKTPYSEKKVVTTVDRDGKTGRRSVPLIGARKGGAQLYAKIQVEV